jgi:hypothetical protein
MQHRLNKFLDQVSEFLAQRKGLLPLVGILLIIIDGVLQFIPGLGWFADSGLLLRAGVIIAIMGFLLAWAL